MPARFHNLTPTQKAFETTKKNSKNIQKTCKKNSETNKKIEKNARKTPKTKNP
jgi:hypothetical protein